MKTFLNLLLMISILFAGCARNPRDMKITEENEETFMQEIGEMEGLTADEVKLLVAAQIQNGFREVLGGEKRQLAGKTVGELLEELKKESATRKEEEQRREKLAAEARAKEEARVADLRAAIQLTVFEKGFDESDFQDYITIKVAYRNTSGKDIRAFQGSIEFNDLFGDTIHESRIKISDPIAAGAKATWKGTTDYNQFYKQHKQLRNTELKDMRIVWKPRHVIFEDGSEIRLED